MNLGPNVLTVEPVLRLDADARGIFGLDRFPGDRPPRLGDRDRPGVPEDGMNTRRARLGVSGNVRRDVTYAFVWEFAPGPGAQFDIRKGTRIFERQAG